MIHSSELMIGDWVYKAERDHYVKARVVGIMDNTVDFIYRSIRGTITENGIEPIPITKEILEKNGFEGDGYAILKIDEHSYLEYYFHEKRLRKIWEGIDEWQNHSEVRDITFQCNCYYVHELQHAFRMCGITKEIEL